MLEPLEEIRNIAIIAHVRNGEGPGRETAPGHSRLENRRSLALYAPRERSGERGRHQRRFFFLTLILSPTS
jgi:hypothetical protein